MKVNEIIRARRKELGLTLKQVADKLGVSESLISRYESNDVKNMGIDKLIPLAKILKTTPAYLMGWEDEKNHSEKTPYNEVSVVEPQEQYNISNKKIALEIIMEAPLVYKTGTDSIYSDVGYMLLGLIIEKVTELSLDDYVQNEIYKPLGLTHITYKPLQNGFKKNDCAATEIGLAKRYIWKEEFSKTENGVLQGIVHDGNAYFAMNQVSGHAGVFANAESIGVLAQVILNGGGYGNVKLFDESITDMFSIPQGGNETQSLGWRRQGNSYHYSWAFSRLADKDTIGHTGWTGSLTLIDRKENLIIVLLTNAKNTSLVKSEHAKGRFEGDFYLLKNYCIIPSFIYASLYNYSNEQIDNMLLELFEQRTILHKKHSLYQNKAFLNDLYALFNTIKRLSAYSRTFKIFLKKEETKQILDYMEGVSQSQ